MFGSGGHLRPPGPGDRVTQYYTKCTETTYGPNAHVKSIVQPKLTERAQDPHSFIYSEGYFAVAPDFSRVSPAAPVFAHVLIAWTQTHSCCCSTGHDYQAIVHTCSAEETDLLLTQYYGVDGSMQVDGPLNHGIQHDKVVLHHFFTKSWIEWLEKMARGSGDGGRKGWNGFVELEAAAVHDCKPADQQQPGD